jgi:hypothetical protein
VPPVMAEWRRPSDVVLHQAEARRANDAALSLSRDAESLTIRCECGQVGCVESFAISTEWLRGIRRNPSRLVVHDGHEVVEVSRVLERRGTVTILESTYVGNGDTLA